MIKALNIYSILICFLLSSCVSTKFSTTNFTPQTIDGNYSDHKTYIITCQAEEKTSTTIDLELAAEKYAYQLHPVCVRQVIETKNIRTNKPLNIVFVLDRTGSMQESINAVKSGIINFSNTLEEQNWDVHFAAIGFRDNIEDFIRTEFTNARDLSAQLESWTAQGGEDFQEAGMEAILNAQDLLLDYIESNNDRSNATNVILYASDGIAYWKQDHQDFDIEKLVAASKENLEVKLKDFQFYYSVPIYDKPQTELAHNASLPEEQMKAFITGTGITGKGFNYPLTRDIINAFSNEFIQKTFTEEFICQINSASFNSNSEKGISSESNQANIYESVNNGDSLVFKTSPDAETQDYELSIFRCCYQKNTEIDQNICPSKIKSTLNFKFNSSK